SILRRPLRRHANLRRTGNARRPTREGTGDHRRAVHHHRPAPASGSDARSARKLSDRAVTQPLSGVTATETTAAIDSDVDLVTGAFGFAASHLIAKLLARGRRVVGTDLPAVLQDAKRRALVAGLGLDLTHPHLELVPADLLDPQSLAPLFTRPIRRVFHT